MSVPCVLCPFMFVRVCPQDGWSAIGWKNETKGTEITKTRDEEGPTGTPHNALVAGPGSLSVALCRRGGGSASSGQVVGAGVEPAVV